MKKRGFMRVTKLLPLTWPWLAVCLMVACSQAQARTDLGQLSPQESYVLQQVGAGKVADLKERFGEEEGAHLIRGGFVEALLTDGFPGFKVPRSGIYLLHAVIPDILSLQ